MNFFQDCNKDFTGYLYRYSYGSMDISLNHVKVQQLASEVLENGWKQLFINLKAAIKLDEDIWTHNYYLEDIETKERGLTGKG